MPWSSGGSTTITYSLNAYGSYPLPSWVSIDLNTGILTITAPNVGFNTDFYFYIASSFSSATILKVIKLTVTDWTANYCQQCSSTSSSSCSSCSSGYVLSSGVWILPSPSTSSTPSNITSDTPKAYTVTTQSVIGCTTTVVVISSLLNSSTMANLWSMIHQVQMFFLLLITKAYIPYEVEKEIKGIQIALNPYDIFKIEKIKLFESFLNKFKFELTNPSLDSLGLNSDSTIYNTYSIFVMLLILSILHVFIYIFYRLFLITSSEGEFSWIIKVFKWVINKFYFIMTFGYYIRNGLELTQIMLISSLNEIYNFNTENGVEILSLLFAFFVLFLCFFTLGLSFYLALTSYKIISTEHNLLGDFFEGLKPQRKFKIYTCIFLIRRIVYIFLLIILSSISSRLLLSILSIFQIGYLVYVIILRPFEGIKSNIIEIMNEIYFFLLLFSLVFLQTENNWSSMITDLYVWVLASNTIIYRVEIGREQKGSNQLNY